MCECVREIVCALGTVCVRERKRESVCVCLRKGERGRVWVCAFVSVWMSGMCTMRQREGVCECDRERERLCVLGLNVGVRDTSCLGIEVTTTCS